MRSVLRGMVPTLALVMTATALAADPPSEAWTPEAWQEESTIELRTTRPGEEPHWFKVWFVVIDGQLYVRLGSRAAERFEENTTRPFMAVRIAGQEFPRVEGIPAPEMVEAVAAAMADKHWSDLFVRHFAHPLTLRLVPR